MGILSALFGSGKLKRGSREKYFAITTAGISLQSHANILLSENAGLVFNPVESVFFSQLETEMRKMLEISGRETGTKFEVEDDEFGTKWVVLHDKDFEDLVTTIHLMGEQITEHGYGDRLLAAVFRMDFEGKATYWIYNIKRGNFYPMVLEAKQKRDNAAEMRMGELMKQERMPVERSLESWYALWGIPF